MPHKTTVSWSSMACPGEFVIYFPYEVNDGDIPPKPRPWEEVVAVSGNPTDEARAWAKPSEEAVEQMIDSVDRYFQSTCNKYCRIADADFYRAGCGDKFVEVWVKHMKTWQFEYYNGVDSSGGYSIIIRRPR